MEKRGNKSSLIGAKKGQVTLFIILALVVIGIAVGLYFLIPQIRTDIQPLPESPVDYMEGCIDEEYNNNLDLISSQGGSFDPSHVHLYNNSQVRYLCYSSEYYETCVMQEAFLKSKVENELEVSLEGQVDACYTALEEAYENEGFGVEIQKEGFELGIHPGEIVLDFNSIITLTREDSTQRVDSFEVSYESEMYDLIQIANSILNFETRFGDSEITNYMDVYNDLIVRKILGSDGTKVYILENTKTSETFQFATRSSALPPGLGVSSVVNDLLS